MYLLVMEGAVQYALDSSTAKTVAIATKVAVEG